MRADQREAPLDLISTPFGQLLEQQFGESGPLRNIRVRQGEIFAITTQSNAGLVRRQSHVIGRGNLSVGGARVGHQLGQGGKPGVQEFGTGLSQLAVPHVQRRVRVGRGAVATPQRLQQGVALAKNAIVVGLHSRQPGPARHEQPVDEAAALRRVPTDEVQIERGEHHRTQNAQELPGPPQRGTIQPGAVRLSGGNLDLQDQRPIVRDPGTYPRSHHGTLRSQTHQRRVAGHAVRA